MSSNLAYYIPGRSTRSCKLFALAWKKSVKTITRNASAFKRLSDWYQGLLEPKAPVPPYSHVCQVGDPVLRVKAELVDINKVKSEEIQKVIETMKKVLRSYSSVGLAAPQIGIPLRIMIMEFPNKFLNYFPADIRVSREMVAFPLQIFINPEIQIINTQKVIFPEACESIRGYSASVGRFREVELSGVNEKGEYHVWRIKGWPARIAQHELDHLNGTLYTDIMDSQSYQYDFWYKVNLKKGKYKQKFS